MQRFDTELLTTKQVSQLLNQSIRQTIRLVESGSLQPAQKLPGLRGAYLFHPRDVRAYTADIVRSSGEVVRNVPLQRGTK